MTNVRAIVYVLVVTHIPLFMPSYYNVKKLYMFFVGEVINHF